MKFKRLFRAASLLLAGAMIFTSLPAASLPAEAAGEEEIKGTADRWENVDQPTLRDYATPSVNFVGWGAGPDNFADGDMDSFWNGHSDDKLNQRPQWMKYDFGERKAEISGMTIKFFDNVEGVVTPTNITVEYTKEDGTWEEVTRTGTWEFAGNVEKTYEFEPVTASQIRVTMEHALSGTMKMPVAVYDWKLLGEIPEDFPKPEPVPPEEPSEDLKLPDAAVYASPSAHYTSDWENVNGINNPEFEPTGSSIGNGLGWGNWPQDVGTECWIQYDWEEAVTTKTFQVYWYGDEGGMKVPSNVRFEYKGADGNWKQAELISNSKNFSKFNQYNQITIGEITTKCIRMYMTVTGTACGVYRWKVYSNVGDAFVVSAAANSLEIPEIKEGRVASRIRRQLTLPAKAMNNKVNVSWKSGNPSVISDEGKITPPAQDTKVTLTATCALAANESVKKEKKMEVMVLSDKVTEYAMTIDQKNKGVDISQELFGVFYEDINSSADGGLAAELVKNNSFENYRNLDSPTAPEVKGDQDSWKLHWDSSNAAGFVVEREAGLNDKNKNYAKITGNQTLSNHGFVKKAELDKSAMAITAEKNYDFSMWMKADSSYAGTVKVKVVDDAGQAVTNEAALELKKSGKWEKISASLKGTATKLGTLVLTFEGAVSSDAMYIDMVSLIPTDSYGYGNKNYSYGKGLRKDLVEKLQELNPSFIRFPGGCVVEGSYGTDGYYNWEDSVGPLEERRAIGSYWGTEGHPVGYLPDGYGYMMSYQFGYHEILTLCEDLGAQPFPILSAGIFCQFRNTAEAVTGNDLKPFAEHATNLIDYCWGSPASSDATQKFWASKRVQNGHEAPFELNYLGIGNENWNTEKAPYYANFTWIKNYVEDYVKEHYPDRKITLISSTGPYYQGSQDTDAWRWINRDMPGETLVDEHYYINYAGDGSNTLLNEDYLYDSYKRLNEGGSNVFIGEYAGHNTGTPENVLDTAISEAAYMTGIERNGDIVRHASYAPLFEREGCRDWDYNLIKFDAYSSYGTPSYYVQTMYSNNYGKHIINTTLEKYNDASASYDEKRGHQTELYYVSSEDENYIYTKLVNHADDSKEITLNYPSVKEGAEVELICLSGNAMDMNTISDQKKIAPVTTKAAVSGGKLIYEVPAMSLTVVKVNYNPQTETVNPPASSESVAKLNSAVSAAEKNYRQEGQYTQQSWTVFLSALDAAKKVASDPNATQEQVDQADRNLQSAIQNLVKIKIINKKAEIGFKEKFSVKTENCTYTTSNKNIAVVNSKGTVTTKKVGKVTISAVNKNGGEVTKYSITIKKAPKKITKVVPAKKTLKKGKTCKLKVTLPKGTASNKITFTSSKKKVATVSSKGVVKAKKKGTAVITVKTFNKKTKKVKITVK